MKLGVLKREIRSRKWKLFSRPFELNIVGVRSKTTIPNRFDDEIHVFFSDDKRRWVHRVYKATTDPGTYWLKNPAMPQGTALLAEQQALGAYRLDFHRGEYYALCQRLEEVDLIRDYNRDSILDFKSHRKVRGFYGINIHRARKNGMTTEVDRWSAGCQVFANGEDFKEFIKLCEIHKSRYGNLFTYSLIDLRTLNRGRLIRSLKWAGLGVGLTAIAAAITYNYTSNKLKLWQNLR